MPIECFLLTWHGSVLCTGPDGVGLFHRPLTDPIARSTGCRLSVNTSLDRHAASLLPLPDMTLPYESHTLGVGTATRVTNGRGYNFVRNGRYLCAIGGQVNVDWDREKAQNWESFLPIPSEVLDKLRGLSERDWANLATGHTIRGMEVEFRRDFELSIGDVNVDLLGTYPTFFQSQQVGSGERPASVFIVSDGNGVQAYASKYPRSDSVLDKIRLRESRGSLSQTDVADTVIKAEEAPYYPPAFAHRGDREFFFRESMGGKPQIGFMKTTVSIRRARNCHMLLGRQVEGVLFGDRGVIRCYGYLEASDQLPTGISKDEGQICLDRKMVDEAPYFTGEHLVFFNGNLQNYFHWMIEGILGLYILNKAHGAGAKIVLPSEIRKASNLQYLESLQVFGLGDIALTLTPAPVVKLESAQWLDPWSLCDYVPDHLLVEFQSFVANSVGHSAPSRRIYIERERFRSVQNAEEVRKLLEGEGFMTVRLEGMSILDQARLFATASFVVGPHGAGLSNLMFVPPAARVIEFMPNMEMRPFFWLISMKLKHEYGMIACPTDSGSFNGNMTVDSRKLTRLLAFLDYA